MKTIYYFLVFMVTAVLATVLSAGSTLAQEEPICEADAIVQEGDWLSTIAQQAYGDPTLYEAIASATNLKAESDSSYAVIDSYDIIEPGWKLCLPAQAVAEEMEVIAPTDPTALLTVEELINATYSGIYEEPVTLTEGRYEGEPFVEGGASRPIVEYISEIYGDLNGDGVEDAAVFLVESSGGSGSFIYIAAQLNQNGQPVDAGAVWIADRIQVISAAIENGQVVLEITAEGPGDAACCKSHKTRASYALQAGLLAEIPGEEQPLARVSAADLNGTGWTLLELNDEQPALAETEVTTTFAGGQITGSGGCNSYSSSFSLGDDNPFVMSISPVVATRRACPEPILNQETAYFSALENVSQWGYVVGRLAIYYFDAGQGLPGRLLFVPAVAADQAGAAAPPTEIIDFVPAEIPTESRTGSCFGSAIGLGREDAYRCSVGNQIFDPCFAVGDQPAVVCGANPAGGESGFVLRLTEPLPEPEVGQLSQPWLVELADGQLCGLMTGTVVGVGERIAPYGCPDQSYLFEDFQQAEVWMAEKAVIGLNEDGFFIEQSEMAPISRIWR